MASPRPLPSTRPNYEQELSVALTGAERSAQRRLLGIIRTSGLFDQDGLHIWREKGAEEWKAGAEQITGYLDALAVPYTVAIARRPAYRSRYGTVPIGWDIRISCDDLPALVRWMPNLEKWARRP